MWLVYRRGEYKPGIYGQCPTSRGKGKTFFPRVHFLRKDATFGSPATLDQADFEVTMTTTTSTTTTDGQTETAEDSYM